MKRAMMFAGACLLLPSPAFASWDLSYGDDNCAITGEYKDDGNSKVTLAEYDNGVFILFIANENWSITVDRRYSLKFIFDDDLLSGNATGYAFSGERGFMISGGADMATAFARSSTLIILKNENTPVLAVKLNGTMAGVARIKPCIAEIRRAKQAKIDEQNALDAKRKIIASDPFAEPGALAPINTSPAVPIGNPSRWTSLDDYPATALREEHEGVSKFRLTVTPAGAASSCEIISSSGHSDLDDATCAMVMRRSRFEPSKSAEARHYESRVTWKIPQ